ncbi:MULTISPECIES: hypothetical protein [unclassified Clostridium]|uniref:hypothetical protein n=1 Tax=unclassified Clostridium TaxID=2614128 RepID=UPI0025C73739|nr:MULTISPECIES: hypothetical protein [unclassified Clostridium]
MSIRYSSYTKRFMDLSNFYIKDGELLKNRGNKFTSTEKEVTNYNNIVIEQNGVVNIYCKSDKVSFYKDVVNFLEKHYSGVQDKIIINCKDC